MWIAEMLSYDFMQKALIVGIALGVIIPCIGVVAVGKHTAMIGDALSHTSLVGVAVGLIASLNPIISAILISVLAALAIDFFRVRYPKQGDLATALVMSSGIGLAAILSDFVPGFTNFESFLFGSIVAISPLEFGLVLGISALVLIAFLKYYQSLLYLSIDPSGAKISGINPDRINSVFTILTAVTIAISARTVGTLLVSSLMVVPVAIALVFAKTYRKTVIYACISGVLSILSGMIASYRFGLKPGGAIVLSAILILSLSAVVRAIQNQAIKRSHRTT